MARKNKTKKRINAFDIAVILLLLCLVATFAYRIYAGVRAENVEADDVQYVLSFTCDEEYDSLLSYLSDGDAVYFEDDKLLGILYAGEGEFAVYLADDQLSDLPNENETDRIFDAVGEITGTRPYRTVTLKGQIGLNRETVRVKDGNYYSINGRNLTAGSVLKVYTENAEFTLRIDNITAIEQ